MGWLFVKVVRKERSVLGHQKKPGEKNKIMQPALP
jgi:hypothetical protein